MPVQIMDNNTIALTERNTTSVNGSMRRPSPVPSSLQGNVMVGVGGRPHSLMSEPNLGSSHAQTVRVTVNRDDKGYGMKVSGDNPVYVQSVKEGGAAEKAGLHKGAMIIRVNGVNVMQSTHTEVVALIKSSQQVVLTVQQPVAPMRNMGSPSLHARPLTTHGSTRITGPQPVDDEKQHQLQLQREQHYRLMIEKEQRHLDKLRSQMACMHDEKKNAELIKTEQTIAKLQNLLQSLIDNKNEHSPPILNLDSPQSSPPCRMTQSLSSNTLPSCTKVPLPHGGLPHSVSFSGATDHPPPLPKRIWSKSSDASYINGSPIMPYSKADLASFESNLINSPSSSMSQKNLSRMSHSPPVEGGGPSVKRLHSSPGKCMMVDNSLYTQLQSCSSNVPPPLPPRNPIVSSTPGCNTDPDAVNSINKQMSYPLVATCATLVNNYHSNHTHHRTKSSPDSLGAILSPAEASRRFIASESMNDLSKTADGWERPGTPPGTPPPPYPSPSPSRRLLNSNRSSANTDDGDSSLPYEEAISEHSPDVSPICASVLDQSHHSRILATNSPITAATPQTTQQPIISMEDDEISDQEVGQLEDHGPFKSLSRLWEHTPHLAVFMNYVLSNSDPSSLLFYLLTDLYKEGSAKEMRKWAYEIHSSFLVPGAPLRLSNVDENIAREIDDVLLREYDKEEILRKIFWKARIRAKEELTKQLADFQQKRTAGLGTIFGPNDAKLDEISHDKAKETKLYENLLLDKVDPFLEEIDRETYDPRKYYTAAALTTVITRVFGVRPTTHALDRCPTFVSKEKSFRTKFIGKYYRKLNVSGHQYVAQQYYTVIACNNCHQIIYGIGPQGYQCSVCLINLHRLCIKLYEDTCPGPIKDKKDRGIGGKLMDRIRPESREHRRKPSNHFIPMERERRLAEERDNGVDSENLGDNKPTQPVSRAGSDRRPDALAEEARTHDPHHQDHHDHEADGTANQDNSTSLSPVTRHSSTKNSSAVSRSESWKGQTEKKKERRKISDPLSSKSKDGVDLDSGALFQTADSGSSSNSSLSSRGSSESPSASLEAVPGAPHPHPAGSGWDSDMEVETDPPDWKSSVSDDVLTRLSDHEKKIQEVINELFHTERSHVRNLKVLDQVFYKPIHTSRILSSDHINLLFPNLDELLDLHSNFNSSMKSKRKENPVVEEVGELLLQMFDGKMYEDFKRAAATFCARQQMALEFIKERRNKDSRFHQLLNECESNKLCRRLPLQGIIPTEMQRLSKYPLLFQNLVDGLKKTRRSDCEISQAEICRLKRALERSKEIMIHVDQAAKEACDFARLQDIQKHLDTSTFERGDHPIATEYRSIDITRYKMIHEGSISLDRVNKPPLQLHMVLFEEMIVLLQKEGEKYLLKFFQSGDPTRSPLSPIIKMSTVLVRPKATSKSSLFLVNTSTQSAQIYEIKTSTALECSTWFKHISEAAEAYNRREGKSKRSEPAPESGDADSNSGDISQSSEERTSGTESVTTDVDSNATSSCSDSTQRNSNVLEDDQEKTLSQDEAPVTGNESVASGGGSLSMKLTTEEWPLIQPSEVHVAVLPIHTAQPVLTPIEQIRRKDEAVRQALLAKEELVADLLCVPRDDYQSIADMASEESLKNLTTDREPSELVLAAVHQANQLWALVNDCLNVSEEDPVLATGGQHPACSANPLPNKLVNSLPSVPAYKIHDIANALNVQLTTLMSVIKQRDEERERLRRELQRMREQLHEAPLHTVGGAEQPPYDAKSLDTSTTMSTQPTATSTTPTQAGDLESIQESPTENEH